ncbi:4707_t:CDS:2, partial [Paraglomus brasilianum]
MAARRWQTMSAGKRAPFEAEAALMAAIQNSSGLLDRRKNLALVPGYDAYFSFTKGKSAYSGVVTYVKNAVIAPVAAEEGISGILSKTASAVKGPDDTTPEALIGCIPSGYTTEELLAIDSEGRCVVLDFNLFTLFNVYCPNESSLERRPFKLKFYEILKARVEGLLQAGKQVIVVGDMNIEHKEIDHCNPKGAIKDKGLNAFGDHPARKWFDSFVVSNGSMVDVCRMFHPDEKFMYTCWSTVLNARPANYGVRIDYILASEDLMKWFKSCNIDPNVMGSDHCPVVAELYDEIYDKQKHVLLDEINLKEKGQRVKVETPRLCAKYMAKFAGKQQTLKSFFTAAAQSKATLGLGKLAAEGSTANSIERSNDTRIDADENTDQKKDTSSAEKLTAKRPRKQLTKSVQKKLNVSKEQISPPCSQTSIANFFKPAATTEESAEVPQSTSFGSQDAPIDLDPLEISDEDIKVTTNKNTEVTSKWNALFTPKPIPNCNVH